MKLLFASDIHGSPEALQKLAEHIENFRPQQIILLGDLLYHGPRNPLKPDYAPQQVAEILNGMKDRIVAVRGNCDAEVDQMMLQFPIMAEYSIIMADEKKIFLSHGHHWNPDKLPPLGTADALAFGHTHIPMLEKLDCGITVMNPGSITLPKGGFPPSFAIFENGEFSIINLETLEIMNKLHF